jgi:hypothetical protein
MCFELTTMPILFLDFDGVLHPEHCHESKHFCCLPVLEAALRHVPNCDVVISSTWRRQEPLPVLQRRFSTDIAARILGITPYYADLTNVPDTLVAYHREAECHAWLRANQAQHRPWLALDDRSWLFRPFCKSLLLTNGRTGLVPADGTEILLRLGPLR